MHDLVYEIGGLQLPGISRWMRICLHINTLPLFRVFTNRIIRKYYKMPETTSFLPGFYCSAPLLQLGENVGLGDTFIVAYAPIHIGDNVSLSFRNTIITSTHDIDNFGTVIGKTVTIGNNVWITTNVTILPGVTIGDNSIIAAGSVVTKDIPSGVLPGGNPCKVIRKIQFSK